MSNDARTLWPLGVKREHLSLIACIWHEWVPIFDPDITKPIAAEVWAKYRACPTSGDHDIQVMKWLSMTIWCRYVAMN